MAAKYCAVQERSQKEVLQKLRNYGLNQEEAEEVLVDLISLDFVHERRFAEAYVRGKFKQLKWGTKKIQQGLQEHNIPPTLIRKVVDAEISDQDYRQTLSGLLHKKYKQVKERHRHFLKRKKALVDYAVQKGYEHSLVYALVNQIMDREGNQG